LGGEASALLKAARPEDSIASWAFRFLQRLPGVQVVLSGMTTLDQLKDNLKTFEAPDPLSDGEMELIQRIVRGMADMVPCTACRYCCEDCPQGLDIPKLISMYNEVRFDNPSILRFTLDAMGPEELPGACLACGACARICPQNIDIPKVLKEFDAALSGLRR
jgi:predicted aldo/keto reductase-like oxidoreductase